MVSIKSDTRQIPFFFCILWSSRGHLIISRLPLQTDYFSNTHQPLMAPALDDRIMTTQVDLRIRASQEDRSGIYGTLCQEFPGLDTRRQQASQQAREATIVLFGKKVSESAEKTRNSHKVTQQDGRLLQGSRLGDGAHSTWRG